MMGPESLLYVTMMPPPFQEDADILPEEPIDPIVQKTEKVVKLSKLDLIRPLKAAIRRLARR